MPEPKVFTRETAAVMPGILPGRWFGVAVAGRNAIAQMFLISAYPCWSLVIIAVNAVVP